MKYPDLRRLPDWSARLVALANERRSLPYLYGSNDCWCWTQAAVEAMTGVRMHGDIPNPTGWLAAAKTMVANGWESVEDVMTAAVGPPLASVDLARAGDVVSFEETNELHLAVRVGDTALTPGLSEMRVLDRAHWRKAWKVG